ncbi:GGDEF domain-containing protein, partial [Lactobacillus crispatus]
VFVIFMMVNDRTVRAHKAAASIDPLTGLLNRRGFSEATARMIEREAKAGRPVTVMIFDIDHFKSINDRFGHPAGDEVLKLFSAVMNANLRITDLIGRIGGEEFAAMLPCSMEETLVAADRVREAFQNCGIEVDDAPVATTVSIGVA